ncbi:MAG: branched-chain amino acid ABC transporter permease, partial [Candidatus Contendobacter sp.]|nr:branched-chain amino acid ABC transporter permease [Candidatus Contendobacter sp.]
MSALLRSGWEWFIAQRWLMAVFLIIGFILAFAIPEYNLLNKYVQLVMMYVGINIILTVSLN